MNTIKSNIVFEQEINKSSFITYLIKVTDVDEAKEQIKNIKNLHPNATHHVAAYQIGMQGEYGHCNDDGEPSGTAGLPILEVIRKNNLTNVLCIVVRYFGGIKLGAGGLIRAYSSSCALALNEAIIIPIVIYEKVSITLSYNYLKIVENKLKDYTIINKDFQHNVILTVMVPKDDIDDLTNDLITTSNNQIIIEIKG